MVQVSVVEGEARAVAVKELEGEKGRATEDMMRLVPKLQGLSRYISK